LHVYSNVAQPAAVFENGAVGIGTNAPDMFSTLHVYDARTVAPAGATRMVLQMGANQAGVNLLEWQDNGGTAIGVIDNSGFVGIGVNNLGFGGISAYLHVYSNGAQPAAVFENGPVGIGTNAPAVPGAPLQVVGPGGGISPVNLQNVPPANPTDEVLRIDATGEVTKSTVAALLAPVIIRGSFPINTTGNSFTISVAPANIQPGATVSVTLVGPSGGTIYPLMVTNIDAAADTITVESSASIPGGAGYAIHYIIINP